MCGLAAWARATYQYHVNGTDTVGRSVDARTPVDHDSVGLAQARPNYTIGLLFMKFMSLHYTLILAQKIRLECC